MHHYLNIKRKLLNKYANRPVSSPYFELILKKYENRRQYKSKNASWSFRGEVFKNFDKHIQKSVPMYEECRNLFLFLTDFFLQENSKIFDLGSSTGTFLKMVSSRHDLKSKKIKCIGMDSVKEMIKYAKINIKGRENVVFKNCNILKQNFKNSCIISSFYTIQFISPSKRQFLIDKIYKDLNWGGAFLWLRKLGVQMQDFRIFSINFT